MSFRARENTAYGAQSSNIRANTVGEAVLYYGCVLIYLLHRGSSITARDLVAVYYPKDSTRRLSYNRTYRLVL